MCCIFGIGLFAGHKIKSSSSLIGMTGILLKEAQIGGTAASGVALTSVKTTRVLRRAKSGSSLAQSAEYIDFMTKLVNLGKDTEAGNELQSIIGHCRWPTQGDPSNHYNNHPVVTKHIVGVHNGMIRNNHLLFKNFEERFDRIAEVDTEIIFQLIAYFNSIKSKSNTVDAIQKTTPYLQGYYACAAVNTRSPYNLYLFRNSAPISTLYYPRVRAALFATHERFIHKAAKYAKEDMGEPVEISTPNNSGIAFNLNNLTMHKFKFRDYHDARTMRGA
jgi:glucosamine 6-phosphate synthetase-like amidotransferase/phosphosugar isomerase protein